MSTFATIAVIVFGLIAVPALFYWLLRPRKHITPGPFHDRMGDGG